MHVVEREHFNQLLDALARRGYELVGPTVREGAIVWDTLRRDSDFPIGLSDETAGGRYRLEPNGTPALFSYAVGPQSLKNYLYPSRSLLCRARGNANDFTMETNVDAPRKLAFVGARACELHAMALQDKVFVGGEYSDVVYTRLREGAFFVAVNCGRPSGTCFCTSMGTGPKAGGGYDLALTEVIENGRHYFTVETGSEAGAAVLRSLTHRPAKADEMEAAVRVTKRAESHMGRTLDTDGIRELLYSNAESEQWERVAERCMACANCTMVCPTCFCSNVEDVTSLDGATAERWRVWDSCFTMDFSYIHGGSVRKTGAARYRQWITHKLASWHDQFGASGCVGCGRCITWCPVGIDITEEVAALRGSKAAAPAAQGT